MIPKGREQKPKLPAEVSDLATALPAAVLASEFKAKPPSGHFTGRLRLGCISF